MHLRTPTPKSVRHVLWDHTGCLPAPGGSEGANELAEVIDWRAKGFPPLARPVALDEVRRLKLDLFRSGFWFPVLVLRAAALENNIATMARYCRSIGVSLAPHAKTSMSPQLLKRLFAAGVWGVTAATTWQARVLYEFGARRILIANEVIEPSALGWLFETLDRDPSADFYCYVDSIEGVSAIDSIEVVRSSNRRLPVLLEFGFQGGRGGCRSVDAGIAVARRVLESKNAVLVGVGGFEGIIDGGSPEQTLRLVDEYLLGLRSLTQTLFSTGSFSADQEVVVSAGGSSYFDRVVAIVSTDWNFQPRPRLVLRSGAYIAHDDSLYMSTSPFGSRIDPTRGAFLPALEIWGPVLSRPEPSLAIIGFGRRDVGFDAGMPKPTKLYRPGQGLRQLASAGEITKLNDQHAFMTLTRPDEVNVGDLIGCGISHPCTSFDKWRFIPVVDDNYVVVEAAATYF